jgi:hypothetical protein
MEERKPTTLVLECDSGSRYAKRERIRDLLSLTEDHAVDLGVVVERRSRESVRKALGLAVDGNKDDVARAVAHRIPSLRRQMPKERQQWDGERYAMAIFTAAALALCWRQRHLLDCA